MAREDDTFKLLERMLFDVTAEPTDLPLSFLKAITDNFSDDKEIGNGGFAVVYKGLLGNGTSVAVKKLSQTLVQLDEEKFIKEVGCLMRVKHKNIVRFLGYCADTQGKVWKHEGKSVMAEERQRLLCFEFMPNGSLDKYITDPSGGLEWRTRYQIIKGICQGLDYLHHQQKIVHLDLKPANILLDYYMVPKIADFGISKSFDEKQTRAITLKLLGSQGYMAPETFSGIITFRSDIYSLGIIIIEILTGKKAYPEMENVLDTWSTRLEVSRVDRQMEHVRVCVEIGIKCIDPNPSERPLTKRIIEMLDETERAYGSIETDSCTSLVSPAKGSGDLGKCTHKVPQETSSESSGGEASEDKFVTWDGTLAMLESSFEWSGNTEVRESPPRPGNSKSNESEPDSKRLRKGRDDEASSAGSRKVREAKPLVIRTRSAIDVLADGFSWRQYGQKVSKGNPHPRTYYKCAIAGCAMRKHVQRSFRDPSFVITTYQNGRHNH